ncbi:tetratricopeptide repeat protein [Flavobacterium crassostreae]|uniref:tetratricopeptide repeat protein n=1 Tax=Flavobacterium crassostreae TaxID=1763534 RepID=UPI000AFCD4DC|nr:tetratricopeptide repeat protein [Flavobacterium crassostreae]
MKKIYYLLWLFLLQQSLQAQQDGYWDKERSITQEIQVTARERALFKVEDLPVGTTELLYRITILDDKQQLASSLVSLLKAIPDPTGISQGSAGAVFLMSKISGQDKCKYALFTQKEQATSYQKTGNTDQSCYHQETPVSKDAKRLVLDQSSCIQANKNNLWFGFESSNWFMSQKIVLEIVPWVDTKSSRGWTLENRKTIIQSCKTSVMARKMQNSDDFCICIEEKIEKKYKFQEFQKLLPIEQAKNYKTFGENCFIETGALKTQNDALRAAAQRFEKNADYSNAIAQYHQIIATQKANTSDYSAIGYNYILTKQYAKAIQFLNQGQQADPTELLIQLRLAHAYLLNNQYQNAKALHKTYQYQNVTSTQSWAEQTQNDFKIFKNAGLPTEDFDRILKLLK